MRHTKSYMRDRVAWLRETLIPDLRESGSDATADDFVMCCEMIEDLLDERPDPPLAGQFVQIAQGEDFDTTYVFDTLEARDLFALFNDYKTTGEAIVLDESFVYSNALEQIEDHSLGVALIDRGVSFEDMPGHAMLELLRWYKDEFAGWDEDDVEAWARNQGPALDAKAQELIENGYWRLPDGYEIKTTEWGLSLFFNDELVASQDLDQPRSKLIHLITNLPEN